ncbi:MAG: TatD family deoxyribonuclease [Bacteroidetes bacterium]|nr:MAG: TatD family deoxyribonuclease [Bacteroidota bacterium]
MILTDTHTHLYSEEFDADREKLIELAVTNGISRFFLPNIDSSSIQSMLDLESRHREICFPMMGLHPCSVKANWQEEMDIVENWFRKRSFVAVGEIGIDLFWDKTFVEEQKIVFQRQVELANHYKVPIVIHSRESFELIYELLLDLPKQEPFGIFHCFTGTEEQANRAIDMGFYLGIGGVVTFKNSGLDKVVEKISLDHMVLETDAPYLAPAPFRGKRNIPEYLKLVAQKLAEIKNVSLEEIAHISTENSKKIFGK